MLSIWLTFMVSIMCFWWLASGFNTFSFLRFEIRVRRSVRPNRIQILARNFFHIVRKSYPDRIEIVSTSYFLRGYDFDMIWRRLFKSICKTICVTNTELQGKQLKIRRKCCQTISKSHPDHVEVTTRFASPSRDRIEIISRIRIETHVKATTKNGSGPFRDSWLSMVFETLKQKRKKADVNAMYQPANHRGPRCEQLLYEYM